MMDHGFGSVSWFGSASGPTPALLKASILNDYSLALRELQVEGKLAPIASRSVETLAGESRIYEQKASIGATIFQLQY